MATNSSTIPTPATPDLCTAKVLIEGTELSSAIHVLSIHVTRELNRIPVSIIYIQDGEAAKATFDHSNTDTFIPGKKIEIKLGYRSQESTVFKGTIIKQSLKIRNTGSFLIVECRDDSIRMTLHSKSAYYNDKKDSDIIEEIIGRYGLQKEVTATTPDLKEVVQYESTDWDFIMCRAEANGHFVMVEDGKIYVKKPDVTQEAILTATFGATILELDAEMDARFQPKGIKAHSWNATDQEVIEAEAKTPTTTNNGNLTPEDLAAALSQEVHDLRHGGKMSSAELQVWADAQWLRDQLAKVRGRVKFQGFADIKPGHTIELEGIGDRMKGKVFVSAVRHQFSGGNWETDAQFGIHPGTFADKFNLRPLPAAGLIPAVSGLQTGIVTKLEDDPDGEDRVKVRLPLISTNDEGTWARVATLDAGNQRGTYFRPEIDDEVIVGFLHDDPRYPVILGMCHSSNKPCPESAKDDNHLKGYVSREKMKLTFDDEKKIIALETPAGNKFHLTEDESGIRIEDQNKNKIILDTKGITIESIKDIIFKAKADIKLEGLNIQSKASVGFKAEGTASAEVSGANTTLKGSAMATIQGGIVKIN
ncbi:MAG TPA: type VI secretion system tip protein VgrG [Saprospiraceae bacterium]|nr:type VI secretion system tip protein VgrG [Saprospiraceae bacterium]